MPIAASSAALVRHLRDRLEEAGAPARAPEGLAIEAMTLPEARTNPGHGIAFVLWRVQPDEPADDVYLRLVEALGDPPLMVPHAVRSVRLRPPAAGRMPDPPGEEMP